MFRFILSRLLYLVPTFIGITIIAFSFPRFLEGDPVLLMAGERGVSPERHAELSAQLGYDQPLVVQYFDFLGRLLHGDLGTSLVTKKPVLAEFLSLFPATVELGLVAILLAVLLGVPIGVIAAIKRGSWFDQLSMTGALVGFSMPTFFTGVVLIIIFAVNLQWFPSVYDTTLHVTDWPSFWKQVRQMIMPVTVLSLYNAAQISRFMRASMLDNLRQDYVRTARAKGLSEKTVVLKHVLRNSLIPVVTVIALGLPSVFGGAIITEQVFRVNGLGQLLISAIQANDIPMVLTLTFIFAILIVAFTLIADLLYGVLDPRIRYD